MLSLDVRLDPALAQKISAIKSPPTQMKLQQSGPFNQCVRRLLPDIYWNVRLLAAECAISSAGSPAISLPRQVSSGSRSAVT
jgi:hypothetical protein